MFRDCTLRVAHAADTIGIRGIVVHAISEQAKAFTLALGFDLSPADPNDADGDAGRYSQPVGRVSELRRSRCRGH